MVAPTLQESFLKLQTMKRSDVSNDSIKTDERGGPGIDLDPAFWGVFLWTKKKKTGEMKLTTVGLERSNWAIVKQPGWND